MTVRKLCFVFALVVGMLAVGASHSHADPLTIDVNKGNVQPMPIAITSFTGANPQNAQIGKDISGVISADLERSGLFKPIDPKAFIQSADSLQVQPHFADWKAINAQGLVQGHVEKDQDGNLRVEFRLWDVYAENQMVGEAFTVAPKYWRRVSHMIADAIYKRVTGEDGYFDTQIVYVAEKGPQGAKRIRQLAIMDQDGENHQYLPDGSDMVTTPRFSPNQREITYMAYVKNEARVYIYHLDSGKRELLGNFAGMTFAPRFSPDGNKVIMSLSEGGVSNIYEMDLRTRHTVPLTHGTSLDTSPCYSPDGTHITFNSDRSGNGNQQLYVMNADGSNQQRISFGEGRYATPVWSPRGDLIAFTKWTGDEFYIGVMRPDGSGERSLASGFLVEGPTWAPNGRVLAFWKQTRMEAGGRGGSVKLYTVDLTGYNERQMVTPLDGSDPAWSPLIP